MSQNEEFNFIIVGAGSAGCVLANLLNENARTRACLIEARPKDNSPLLHIPAALFTLMRHRTLN
jgi:choline dehydrogenase